MSIIPPGISRSLQFYLSGPMPCPYLPAQVERKLFVRLDTDAISENMATNSALCRAGFRRSHDIVYRPACSACNACVPVRIPASLFSPSRSLRRVIAQNRALTWSREATSQTDELFALFSAYQAVRHSDSEMARMSERDFTAMLGEGDAGTELYCLRDARGGLKGCMLADPVGDGFSAVYSFYAPESPARSLGTFLILSLIAEAARQSLPFVYLGYWVAASRKMAYKDRFQPFQTLGPNGWEWSEG